MTDRTQPEALRLADEVDEVARTYPDMAEVSAELRRQLGVVKAHVAVVDGVLAQLGGTDPDQRSQRRLNLRCLGLEPRHVLGQLLDQRLRRERVACGFGFGPHGCPSALRPFGLVAVR